MNNKTKFHALDNGVHENLLKSKSSWVCRTIYWTSFGYLPDLCLRVLLFIAHIHINYIPFFLKNVLYSFFLFHSLSVCMSTAYTHSTRAKAFGRFHISGRYTYLMTQEINARMLLETSIIYIYKCALAWFKWWIHIL